MDKSHVSISNQALTITAQPVAGQRPASHGGKSIPIKYLSGAVHAKQQFTVTAGGGLEFSASFRAPMGKGTWPAFWLTAVKGWPPEIDMAEWKGRGKISFNTFNTSKEVAARDVAYPNPDGWHAVRAELRDKNGRDVEVKFSMDGKQVVSQVGRNYVGQKFWL
jgi:beta-glucanase (GH16 family)